MLYNILNYAYGSHVLDWFVLLMVAVVAVLLFLDIRSEVK
jgi:hypothetical protein